MATAHVLFALPFLSALLIGCSDAVDLSPEDQIRTLLDQAEGAVETRDLTEAAGLISTEYMDRSGRDRQQLRSLLAGYFLRHRQIHVLKQIQQITFSDEKHSRVILYAGITGSRAEYTNAISQWRGDFIRLEIDLVLEENEDWRVLRASWQRASRGDLFQ